MLFIVIKGMEEQKYMQIVLSILRFVIIGLLILTGLELIIASKEIDSGDSRTASFPTPFNIKDTGGAMSTIIFCLFYHMQVPSLYPLIGNRKKNLWKIDVGVILTCCGCYWVIGMIMSLGISGIEA